MFLGAENKIHYSYTMFLSNETIVILILALVMSFNGFNLTYNYLERKFNLKNHLTQSILELTKYVGLLIMFIYCVMNVASGSYNPFIYFRF